MSIPSYQVIGVRVSAATIDTLHAAIDAAVKARQRFIMVSQNLHSVYLRRDEPALRDLQAIADCVRLDGMPLLWFAKLSAVPLSRENRIGWMDWLDQFMATAQVNGWRIYYVGSHEWVKDEALARLQQRFTGLQIAGHSGYFDATKGSEDGRAVIERAHDFRADVLLVGMGMPRQERWLHDHLDTIRVPVLLTCGAAMDYVAGAQATPPRWLGRMGLEWLYRLLANPRGMWFRYLVEPWYALGLFARSVFRKRPA